MKNYKKSGDVSSWLAPYAVTSGDGMMVGVAFGVALTSALIGAPVEAQRTGIVALPKVSTTAFAQGAAIYWDDSAKVVKATGAGFLFIGHCETAVGNPSSTVEVRLNNAASAVV